MTLAIKLIRTTNDVFFLLLLHPTPSQTIINAISGLSTKDAIHVIFQLVTINNEDNDVFNVNYAAKAALIMNNT